MAKRMTDERFKQLRTFIESRHGAFIATEDVAGLELLQEVQRARESETAALDALAALEKDAGVVIPAHLWRMCEAVLKRAGRR